MRRKRSDARLTGQENVLGAYESQVFFQLIAWAIIRVNLVFDLRACFIVISSSGRSTSLLLGNLDVVLGQPVISLEYSPKSSRRLLFGNCSLLVRRRSPVPDTALLQIRTLAVFNRLRKR